MRPLLTMPSWKDIWNRLTDATGGIKDFLGDIKTALTNPLIYTLAGLANIFHDALHAVGAGVGIAISGAGTLAGNAIGAAKDSGVYALGGLANIVHDALNAVGAGVGIAISGVGTLVSNAAGAAKDALVFTLGGLANIVDAAIGKARDAGVYTLGGLGNIIADGAKNLIHTITDAAGGVAQGINRAGDALYDFPNVLHKALFDFGEYLWEQSHKLPGVGQVEENVKQVGELAFTLIPNLEIEGLSPNEAANAIFEWMIGQFTPSHPVHPDDVLTAAADAIKRATAFGLAARVPGIVWDYAGKQDASALSDVAAFISKFSDWDRIIDAALGTAIDVSLAGPMQYHVNERARASLPRLGDLLDLWRRRYVEPSTLTDILHKLGYNDDWIAIVRENAFVPLRRREVEMIADNLNLGVNERFHLLEKAGYSPEMVTLLSDSILARTLSSARSALRSELMTACTQGFISVADLAEGLRVAGLGENEIALWELAAQMSYANAVRTEMQSAFRSAAGRDAMTDEELRAGLAQLGLTSTKIDVEVARANVARLKKPVDDTAAAERAAVNKARETMTQAYRLQYRKGVIDEQTFLAALTFIGVPEVQARAVVALTNAESLEVPKAAPVDTPELAARRTVKDLQDAYVLQYQHDLIDADTLRSALEGTGMAPYEADAITLREKARKTPSPEVAARRTEERVALEVQETLSTAYAQQYQQGFIAADELESALVAAGFDPSVAHARRLLEESKAYGLATKSRESTEGQASAWLAKAHQTAAIEAFRKGVITADVLEAALVDIGLSPELAASIRQYEEIHALSKPAAGATQP